MRRGSAIVGILAALAPSAASAQDTSLTQRAAFAGLVDSTWIGGNLASDGSDSDVQADALLPNSTFNLTTIPSGATLRRAQVYWGGSQDQTSGTATTCGSTMDGVVTFTPPAGGARTLTANTSTDCICNPGASVGYDIWRCTLDVTSHVGVMNGLYTVADYSGYVQASLLQSSASWSLVLIYDVTSGSDRRIVLLDGNKTLDRSSSDVVANGFDLAASPGLSVAYYGVDGDDNGSNNTEELLVSSTNGVPTQATFDVSNPATNFANSKSNLLGGGLTPSMDLDRFAVPNAAGAAGDAIVTSKFTADADKWWLFAVVVTAGNAPLPDVDKDGYNAVVDCNDANAAIHPDATEVCDLVDNDCDGKIDEDLTTKTYYADSDKDGYGGTTSAMYCKQPTGFVATSTDCDDTRAAVHPGALELCNTLDDDCDTLVDEADAADAKSWYTDLDEDGYGTTLLTKACAGPAGSAAFAGDCDDADATIHPFAPDAPYDGIDQDCDGKDPVDLDGDGYGASSAGGTDCADAIKSIHPGVPDTDNGIDDDCDGLVDEGSVHFDDDGDGFTEAGGDCDDKRADTSPVAVEICDGRDQDCDGTKDDGTTCYDDDKDGVTEQNGDCDDANSLVRPGAVEIVNNGVDDNCDGNIDGESYDPDGDGWITSGGDCDQQNANVYPGATELPNGKDDDCDGVIDEGTTAYDDDGDGFPEQFGDCDDGDEYVYTGADEDPTNGRDDDCDGLVDEGTDRSDDDGDGFTEEGGDCDDSDPGIGPHAAESADGVDDDCDGEIDEGFVDLDGDGISSEDGDCDDNDGWTSPDRPEQCDGVDNNCDERIDEGCEDDGPDPFETGTDPGPCGCGGGLGATWLGALGLLFSRRRRASSCA